MGLVTPVTGVVAPIKSNSNDTQITTSDIATAVKDVYLNRTAIAPEAYPDVFNTLMQWGSGTPVTVEYFKKRGPFISNQSIDTSFSMERAAVHFSFDLIHNLEFRIEGQLDIATDTDATETAITGVGYMYPGMRPNVGDIFYLKLPNTRIGVFIVNLTKPLSIQRGTYYQIEFHMDGYLTENSDMKMREAVSDELYFDKQYYFSDEAALLSDTSYTQLAALSKYRKQIISRLMTKFYYQPEKTLIRPVNIYDPHLVEFLLHKIGISDTRRDLCHITNPFGGAFDGSIWAVILSRDVTKLDYIGYTLNKYQQYLFDVGISNIDNFRVVSLLNASTVFDIKRMIQAKFEIADTDFKKVSYYFSDRFYASLLTAYETASTVESASQALDDMVDDDRIYANLSDRFYSSSDNTYHDISFFDTHSRATSSNNDMGLPEIEYLVFDLVINNNVDVAYFMELLMKFPFPNMTDTDQLYTLAILLHLIDVTLPRIR